MTLKALLLNRWGVLDDENGFVRRFLGCLVCLAVRCCFMVGLG